MTAATNTNAVVIANASSTTGAMTTVRATSGAFYSTGNDVKPAFGTLPVAQGGTGATTVTQYGVVYGSSTSAYSSVKATAANQVLLATATNVAPTWKGISAHTYTYPTGIHRTQDVTLNSVTFSQITGVGTLPQLSPTTVSVITTATVSNEVLIITAGSVLSASGWSAGTLPTAASVTAASTVNQQPTFEVDTATTSLTHAFA